MDSDNRPVWVIDASAAFARGDAAFARGDTAYREGAEIIVAAMKAAKIAGMRLTQAEVAAHFGHKAPWANGLLKWHKAGYPPGGVFGPEIALRRAKISTSKFPECEHWPIFDPPPVDRSEATRRVLAAQARCAEFTREFIRTVNALRNAETLELAFAGDPDGKRRVLEKLVHELEKSIRAGSAALCEVLEPLDVLKLNIDEAA